MNHGVVNLPGNFKSFDKAVFLPFFQFQRQRQTTSICTAFSHRNPSFLCRISSAAELGDLAFFQQLRQRALDGDLADIRAFGHDFTLGDLAEVVLDDLAHPVGLGQALGGQQLDPALEIPVRRHQNTQHIGDKGGIVVGSLVPVAGAFLQRFVRSCKMTDGFGVI